MLFNRLKTRLSGLQCCVVAEVKYLHLDESAGQESVVLDVIGWRAGMQFVNAVV